MPLILSDTTITSYCNAVHNILDDLNGSKIRFETAIRNLNTHSAEVRIFPWADSSIAAAWLSWMACA